MGCLRERSGMSQMHGTCQQYRDSWRCNPQVLPTAAVRGLSSCLSVVSVLFVFGRYPTRVSRLLCVFAKSYFFLRILLVFVSDLFRSLSERLFGTSFKSSSIFHYFVCFSLPASVLFPLPLPASPFLFLHKNKHKEIHIQKQKKSMEQNMEYEK